MRVGFWNVDGLSQGKEASVLSLTDSEQLDAVVLCETWIRPNQPMPQSSHALWQRLDIICLDLHANAVRGKGGVSLLVRHSQRARLERQCAAARWGLWSTTDGMIAGVYTEPSMTVGQYEETLSDLAAAINEERMRRTGPVVVVGDFNARLGVFTGDRIANSRQFATQGFLKDAGVRLLNSELRNSPSRWTFWSHSGQSIVDLAMASGHSAADLRVLVPPVRTSHRLLVVDVAGCRDEIILDPSRWNWSRRAFSSAEKIALCGDLLRPTMSFLSSVWKHIRTTLDNQLIRSRDEATSARSLAAAQHLVDEGYSLTCRAIRCSLIGMACWTPKTARRGLQHQPHVDWRSLEETSNAFFLSSVKSALQGVRTQSADQARPGTDSGQRPTADQFADHYRDLFARDPETPVEPRRRVRKLTDELPDAELSAFSVFELEELLRRAEPKKAIGPDNLPADVYMCCKEQSAAMLQNMFLAFWAHQTTPIVWKRAYIVPIEKKDSDLSDPAQWRGIALQSHTKKLFEVCIRRLCHDQGWTRTHVLQTGFQKRTGAVEAVYVMDELTSKYAADGRPLSLVLLDIRKAYDRTPRAFVYRKLERRGMPDHAIGVIQSLMEDCQVVILGASGESRPANVEVGVPQGDVLSPDLFNVYVDDLAERLVFICERFGGCPKFGDTDIPIVMYADDQTLAHWRRDAMQAMLNEAQAYAEEHQYRYNVRKCVVSHPPENAAWYPLLLDGEPIPVADTTSLLGVKVAGGRIDHKAQLADRLQQAANALNGLDMLGAFKTPYLSTAKKSLLITAYGRSRVEYGMAIAPHTRTALQKVDSLMLKVTGKCLGGRGTALSMRYCGIVPAMTRMSQLRMRFVAGLRAQARRGNCASSLAARVYTVAEPSLSTRQRERGGSQPRGVRTVLRQLLIKLPVNLAASRLTDGYTAEFRRMFNRDPDAEQAANITARAVSVALRQQAWEEAQQLKLIHIQQQDYNRPHPAAYIGGAVDVTVGRWLCNLIPGNHLPCTNCEQRRPVSRYHLHRCFDTAGFLGDMYCPVAHAAHLDQTDTIPDAMLMGMVPSTDRVAEILKGQDKCPYQPRRKRIEGRWETVPALTGLPEPSRPWKSDDWRLKLTGIATAIAVMRQLCCSRPNTRRSRPSTDADRRASDDYGVYSQAFPPGARALEVFTAGSRRASPPVLPPAR